MIEKEKLLYRISKEDAAKRGMNMDKFYRNRRKKLYPFLTQDENVVWLKRKEFSIAAVKKRDVVVKKRGKEGKHKKGKNKIPEDAIDFTHGLSEKGYKILIFALGSIVTVYLLFKIIEAVF